MIFYIFSNFLCFVTSSFKEKIIKKSNPGFLIFNRSFSDKAITISNFDEKKYLQNSYRNYFPIHLEKISADTLTKQLFHIFSNKISISVSMRSIIDNNLRVLSDSHKIYVIHTDNNNIPNTTYKMVNIPNTSFFKIKSKGKCLTAFERIDKLVVLNFRECKEDKEAQDFSFATQGPVVCMLTGKMCPKDEMEYLEDQKKFDKFITGFLQ